MDAPSFRIAAAQLTSRDDRAANLASVREAAVEAAAGGAHMLVLPECFAFLGGREQDKLAIAELIDPERPGPVQATLGELAREHSMWVIGGGMAELRPGDSAPARVFNTAVVYAPTGELRARYRKIHLFDVDIPGGAVVRESDSTFAGEEVVVATTPLATVGLSICYDLRFPELYRGLVSAGAEVLVVPSAFTAHTGAAHWHTLLRARAIENQCYVVAPAQVGRHNDKRESYGHTVIIDPWGTVVAELAEGTGVVSARIDRELLAKTRRQMPCLDHRRL
jgi:predicted amidohydrolase